MKERQRQRRTKKGTWRLGGCLSVGARLGGKRRMRQFVGFDLAMPGDATLLLLWAVVLGRRGFCSE